MDPIIKKRLFSRVEYYQMADSGILTCTDKTELIAGEILLKSPTGSYHSSVVARLNATFAPLIGDKALINLQNPIHLSEFSDPEPDFFLLKPRDDFYAKAHPTPQEVLLLIEVSKTTYAFDKNTKLPLYAQAGIPEVWIINLNESQVEVFKQPQGEEFREKLIFRQGESIEVEVLSSSVAVRDLLG